MIQFIKSRGTLGEWAREAAGALAVFALVPVSLFLALGMGWL